jgi:asparagine synthase (glutamine-hydrolysing)
MCGIVGIFSYHGNDQDRGQIKKMTDTISHRGPDADGYFSDDKINLGHRRLSIIDLSTSANQPMISENGRYVIVFNGEVYNFPELKRELEADGVVFKTESDTEVILELFAKIGYETPARLRGMFAFAIWDNAREELFIARDRLGKKPLKFYSDDNQFIFASELKAILTHPSVPKEIDYDAIDQFLSLKYVPAPKTGFIGIAKLPPAHFMTISRDGEIKKERYWQLNYTPKQNHSEAEWLKLAEDKLKESIRIRLMADVPIGAHLSGGIDSSLIVALMSEMVDEPVKTYSIGFTGDDVNELPYANLVAEKYKTDHHTYHIDPKALDILSDIVWYYEEPYADASAIPSWYLAEMTSRDVSVVLNGDGGDESFAGYDRYRAVQMHKFLRFLPFKITLSTIMELLYEKTKKKIFWNISRLLRAYRPNQIQFFSELIKYVSDEEKEKLYTEKFRTKLSTKDKNCEETKKLNTDNTLDELLSIGVETHLPDDLLVKVDIASMAHGLEARSPMLDHEFMELVALMPAKLKLKDRTTKYLLKKIAYKYLPKECIDRKKQGFVLPVDHWLRTDLYDHAKKRLLDGNLDMLGLDEIHIEKMLEQHKTQKKDYANELWTLLMLREWLEIWEFDQI